MIDIQSALIGLFIGGPLGFFVCALCVMAKEADDEQDRALKHATDLSAMRSKDGTP